MILVCSAGIATAQYPEATYTDDCVIAQVASITTNVTAQQIQVKVDLIPKWADRFNLSCLRNIVISFGGFGFGGLNFPNPFDLLSGAVCNAIGNIGG
jgi:hypothetical protein